jgi:hypothetical protein
MANAVFKSDLHDMTLALHHQTEKAILVSETGDEKKAVWLPKSKVEFALTGKVVQAQVGARKFPIVTVTLPEWLATDKGLV